MLAEPDSAVKTGFQGSTPHRRLEKAVEIVGSGVKTGVIAAFLGDPRLLLGDEVLAIDEVAAGDHMHAAVVDLEAVVAAATLLRVPGVGESRRNQEDPNSCIRCITRASMPRDV